MSHYPSAFSQGRVSPFRLSPDHTIEIDDDAELSGLESPLALPVSDNLLVGKGMTLKEQEQVVDSLRKENYNLRMKIYFLEERLQSVSPAHMNETLRDNVELRFQLNHLQSKVAELEDELEASHAYSPKSINRIAERENVLHNQIQSLTQNSDNLEMQLHEVRESKLVLEDELHNVNDDYARTKAALDLVNTESTTLRTELEFARNQVQGLRNQLIDAGVDNNSRQRHRTSSPSNRRGTRTSPGQETRPNRDELETQLGHLQAQISAQHLIITAREKELKKANSEVSILTTKLELMNRELELIQAGSADYKRAEQSCRDPIHADAAQIQISELHRKLSSKAAEVKALRHELDSRKIAQEEAVSDLTDARIKDQNALKRQVADLKWQLSRKETQLQNAQQTILEKEEAKNMAESLAGRFDRQSVRDIAARDEEFANAGSEIDRLNELVKIKSREVSMLQMELANHVQNEAELREEMASIRNRVGSQLSASQATTTAVNEMEAEVRRVTTELNQVEAKWRSEVSARCAVEERELSRVAELDKKLRSATTRCADLEHHLKSAEEEIRTLTRQRDSETQAESTVRAAQTDHLRESQEYRRQIQALEKSATEARTHSRRLMDDVKARDAEICKLRDQMTTWQAEADSQHSKLTQMVAQAQSEAAKARNSVAHPRSSGSDDRYRQLSEEYNDVMRQLKDAKSEIQHLTLNQTSSANSMLYKILSRALSAMGKPVDSITAGTPWSILEDHLLREVGQLMQIKAYFNTRVRSLEEHWASEFQLLMGKFDRKLQQMNRVEQAIRVVTQQVRHMKSVFVQTKQAAQVALEQRQVAEAELGQLKRIKSNPSISAHVDEESSELRQRIGQLESNLRLERQGAKRSVEQSYRSIRDLERQLEAARKMNVEYQGLLQHQRSKLEMALNSPSDRRFYRLKEELREMRSHEDSMARATAAKPATLAQVQDPSALMTEALENMRLSGLDGEDSSQRTADSHQRPYSSMSNPLEPNVPSHGVHTRNSFKGNASSAWK